MPQFGHVGMFRRSFLKQSSHPPWRKIWQPETIDFPIQITHRSAAPESQLRAKQWCLRRGKRCWKCHALPTQNWWWWGWWHASAINPNLSCILLPYYNHMLGRWSWIASYFGVHQDTRVSTHIQSQSYTMIETHLPFGKPGNERLHVSLGDLPIAVKPPLIVHFHGFFHMLSWFSRWNLNNVGFCLCWRLGRTSHQTFRPDRVAQLVGDWPPRKKQLRASPRVFKLYSTYVYLVYLCWLFWKWEFNRNFRILNLRYLPCIRPI